MGRCANDKGEILKAGNVLKVDCDNSVTTL